MKDVTIKNETPNNIWVMIAEHQKHLIETKTKTISEIEFDTYYKIMVEGKAKLPVEGIPIEASARQEQEFKLRLKRYWEEHQEAKFNWNEFIEAGELEIAPHKQNRIARKGDETIYYISIRTTGGNIVANSVARGDDAITVDPTGHIADVIAERTKIENDSTVFLQRDDSEMNLVGDPQTSNTNWDAGTFGNTGGSHSVQGEAGKLAQGIAVRIVSNSKTLVDPQYKYMYSAEGGNIYYDKERSSGSRAGKKQLWKLNKTKHRDNSSDDQLYYGDRVKISNIHWPKANLGVKGQWLQCVNDEPTRWILSAKATVD